MALHARYDEGLDGVVLRDEIDWRRTLACAGNPHEEFRVARDAGGALAAYARGAVLAGFYLVTELARRPEPDAAERLADLLVGTMAPRAPDPFEVPGRASAELRRVLVAPPFADPPLLDALRRRGVELGRFESRDAMLRVLDADALERVAGVGRVPGEEPASYLRRLLPAVGPFFWPSDRF
jgi:hypothetical protein